MSATNRWIALVRAVLAELVAVKDINERAAALHFAGPSGPLGEGWEAEWKRLQREYIERQPKAWAAARQALQDADSVESDASHSHSDYADGFDAAKEQDAKLREAAASVQPGRIAQPVAWMVKGKNMDGIECRWFYWKEEWPKAHAEKGHKVTALYEHPAGSTVPAGVKGGDGGL